MSTILLYPKLKCPVKCEYCFADPNAPQEEYNKELMVKTLEKISKNKEDTLILHGGEILSLPIDDLKFFLKSIFKLRGETCIQTSLFGLNQKHIKLFKKYKTNIGISVDGPPELNILRGPRLSKENENYQKEIIKNMKWLKKEGLKFGIIAVLTKCNAVGEKLELLIKWAKENKIGGRFNPMFVPFWSTNLSKYQLTPEELKIAWIRISEECIKDSTLMWQPAREFIDNLIGCSSLGCCTVARCDYITTVCQTIMPDGNVARCDRCFQDGYYYVSEQSTQTRAEVLKQTECKGCKYFDICGGGCAGEGTDGDPRRKSSYCESYYGIYEFLESRIRGMFPNVVLTPDVPNYYDELYIKNKRINFVEKFQNGSWQVYYPPQSSQIPTSSAQQHTAHEDYYMGE